MAASDSLRRLVTRQSWWTSHGIAMILWTLLAAVCLLLVLALAMLELDLLVTRGRLPQPLPAQAVELLSEYSGPRTGDTGLLATAVRFRAAPGWQWLPGVVLKNSALQRSASAFTLLMSLSLAIMLLAIWALSQARYHAGTAAREQATGLRAQIHRQTLRLGPSDISESRHQTALQLFTADTERLRETLAEWRLGVVHCLIFVPLLTLAVLCIEWRLGLQCLIPLGFCWWVYQGERRRRSRDREIADSHVETEVNFLAEGLRKTRLVRGFNIEEFQHARFQEHLEKLNRESQTARRQERRLAATGGMLLMLGGLLVCLLIGLRVLSPTSAIPLASGGALLLALGLLAIEIPTLEKLLAQQTVIRFTADRLFRYLDEIPEVGQAVGARFIQPVNQSIALESISYQRDRQLILDRIDLRIPAKSQTALVSLDPLPTRTLAYLLPRFIEPTQGRVLFDGQDIAWGTLESIRAEVLYVGGDDPVLNGTVAENLICGESRYSLNDATEAAKLAHAHSFIVQLPQGYETVLGEHGLTLLPGQAFRLNLARAILRNPAVMIIEEPNVLLDEDTKGMIDDCYQRLAHNHTLIYLPSRISTVRRCQQVVLLHEGRIDAVGTHSELKRDSELYRHWDYIRFNSFRRLGEDKPAA